MQEMQTSPAVMTVIVLCALFALGAWWQSERRRRCTRDLALYLEEHEPRFWRSLPWAARHLNVVGGVERYRRTHPVIPAAFAALYAARRRHTRAEIAAIAGAAGLVALLVVGVEFWGWRI